MSVKQVPGYLLLKRSVDIFFSVIGFVICLPFICLTMLAVWLQDFHSPIYFAQRTGKGGNTFRMVKIRSMRIDADRINVWATSHNDPRITKVGSFIRAFKLDELPQLWNVVLGDMSLVGPRPLALSETDVYTELEKQILTIQPGITDISSIVFADEGDILRDSDNPTADYDSLIRPWKSRLALVYVEHRSFILDIQLIILTLAAIINRAFAMKYLASILTKFGINDELLAIVMDVRALEPILPPGAEGEISRHEVISQ